MRDFLEISIMFIILTPLEFLFPYVKINFISKRVLEDIFYFILNSISRVMILTPLLSLLADQFSRSNIIFSLNIENQSYVLQLFILVVIQDSISFFGHYFLHKIPLLWNIHKLHHSSNELTSSSGLRHSLWEMLYNSTLLTLFTSFLQVNFNVRLIVSIGFQVICLFQHSNINWNFNQLISAIFITPHNHRWHHSINNILPKGQNFGFLFTFWDRVFKSFYLPNERPSIGLNDQDFPQNKFKAYIYPLLK